MTLHTWYFLKLKLNAFGIKWLLFNLVHFDKVASPETIICYSLKLKGLPSHVNKVNLYPENCILYGKPCNV